MANIKNLQMWQTICSDARVSIRKSLFGLSTTATYGATGSKLTANVYEYSHDDGEQLRRLLESSQEKTVNMFGGFHPNKTVNGNFMVEVCASQDGEFVAVLLNQFVQMGYEPVSDILIFEGKEAQNVLQLF